MKHTSETQTTKVKIMILITKKKKKTNKILAIIQAIQETTTRAMETKETAIPKATIRTNQSTYQSC